MPKQTTTILPKQATPAHHIEQRHKPSLLQVFLRCTKDGAEVDALGCLRPLSDQALALGQVEQLLEQRLARGAALQAGCGEALGVEHQGAIGVVHPLGTRLQRLFHFRIGQGRSSLCDRKAGGHRSRALKHDRDNYSVFTNADIRYRHHLAAQGCVHPSEHPSCTLQDTWCVLEC